MTEDASIESISATSEGQETRAAILRFLAVSLTLILACVSTYVLPAFASLRPWVPGEALPLERLAFWGEDTQKEDLSLGFAGEGYGAGDDTQVEQEIEELLGASVAANLGAVMDEAQPTPETSKSEPVPVEKVEAKATEKPPEKQVRVDPGELEGLVVEIEDPEGKALAPFYEKLRRVALGEDKTIARISHYGDSTIAADGITQTLRRRLQAKYGDAGHGYLLIARGSMPYGHKNVYHWADDSWELYPILRDSLRDGWYGFGGVQYRSLGGSKARFGTTDKGPVGRSVSRFEIHYQKHKRGGVFSYSLDKGDHVRVQTRVPVQEDAWEVIEVPDGQHRLEIRARGKGQSRLYGVVMEREGPGVVYDSLGIVGARAKRLMNAEQEHMSRQISHRSPDLLILAFGGNEAGDRHMRMSRYEEVLTDVVRFMRKGNEEMPCLLFSPLDQAERNERGRVKTIPIIPKIVETQRKVALAEGCGFFDAFSAMGGKQSMARWYRAKPRLAWGDFRHATPAGYEVMGNMFYKALLKGFKDHLERGATK